MKTKFLICFLLLPSVAFSQGLKPKNVPGGVKVEDPFENINKSGTSPKDRETAMKYLEELGYGKTVQNPKKKTKKSLITE